MLTNFVSVLGILLVAAFVVMGIYFMVERVGGYFAAKRREKIYQPQHNCVKYTPYNYSNDCSRKWSLISLETRMRNIENKLGFIDDEQDENLVDIVKYLREDVNNILSTIKSHEDLIKQLREEVNKNAGLTFSLDDIVSNKSEEESDAAKIDA